jgi:hypothetical protein
MTKFIITSEKNGEPKRAVYFGRSGKRRLYRQSMDSPQKGMKIREFTSLPEAQELCDHTNKTFNDDFKVEEVKN